MSARPARPTHLIGQRVTVKKFWAPEEDAEVVQVTRVVWDKWIEDYRLKCEHDDGRQTLSYYYASDVVSTTSPVDKAVTAEPTQEELDTDALWLFVQEDLYSRILTMIQETAGPNTLGKARMSNDLAHRLTTRAKRLACAAHEEGESLAKIGDALHVTRQRAHQIVKGS